jgi:two-component system sensor histidine kinase HupT/HoxJ
MPSLRAGADAGPGLAEEGVWLDVIRKMDEVYNDLLQYQVALEEKHAALEDSQQFISSVLSSMSDLLIVCNRVGAIESVNPALGELLGIAPEALAGRPVFELFADEASSQHAARIFAEQRAQPIVDCEMSLRSADGGAVPVSLNCTPRYSGVGKLLGQVITGRPLGELRRAYHALRQAHEDLKTAQRQLVQSEKLASLGRLVAGVAHELNNPISFVYGNSVAMKRYAERMARYLDAVHGDVSREEREVLRAELRIDRLMADLPSLIDGTLEGAERTRDIVDALKRFAASDRDQRERFDLAAVVERAVHWVGKATPGHFGVHIEIPVGLEIEGSPGQIQQVVMNLVQNAADACQGVREGGSGMPAVALEIKGERVGGLAVLRFHDHGPGIPEAHLDRLFDPFFTTKPAGKGTGLGLAISYGICERHGGELTAANHPQGGAEFTLRLPLAKGA